MSYTPEYILSRQVAYYIRAQYPKVMFHFDPTGMKLTKTQAGMLKAIQGGRGWPDLFIAEPRGKYKGLFIELKQECARIQKVNGDSVTTHLAEQKECMGKLSERGYKATFGIGFNQCKRIIDEYLNG